MKKAIIAILTLIVCGKAMAGQVGLPTEQLAMPAVSGDYLICVWDETSQQWLQSFENYDHTGTYDFQVPAWGNWYWVGLWDADKGEYVFSKWVGHFIVE